MLLKKRTKVFGYKRVGFFNKFNNKLKYYKIRQLIIILVFFCAPLNREDSYKKGFA
jgi:hypothetical protein